MSFKDFYSFNLLVIIIIIIIYIEIVMIIYFLIYIFRFGIYYIKGNEIQVSGIMLYTTVTMKKQ